MVYNMGTQDQPIGEIGSKVNDNAYHIIRFTRNGANSTLQLDDFNTHTIFPAGKKTNGRVILVFSNDFFLFFSNVYENSCVIVY